MATLPDLFSDENTPIVKQRAIVYHVRYPHPMTVQDKDSYWLHLEVDEHDYVEIQNHSYFRGKQFKNMEHTERMEVYELLTEWELCEWRKIGPEDSELFATKKLRSTDAGT